MKTTLTLLLPFLSYFSLVVNNVIEKACHQQVYYDYTSNLELEGSAPIPLHITILCTARTNNSTCISFIPYEEKTNKNTIEMNMPDSIVGNGKIWYSYRDGNKELQEDNDITTYTETSETRMVAGRLCYKFITEYKNEKIVAYTWVCKTLPNNIVPFATNLLEGAILGYELPEKHISYIATKVISYN